MFEGFAASTIALALYLEQTAGSEDGSLKPAGLSAMKLTIGDPEAISSSASPESGWVPRIMESPDSPPDSSSEPPMPVPSKCGQDASTLASLADSHFLVQP